ncbi:hypothetical protein [Mycobacterium noviomagense]|uniref:hypothetical protein n=1 Tax=Mycobacterium noviomagense TaxID=459858 RepID=UPI0013D5B506|nr:hypothetical protein [Mycobacterium noviomagense]
MADEQRLEGTPDSTGEHPRRVVESRPTAPADQTVTLPPAPTPSIVRRHPVGVAVGTGVAGLIAGAILTATLLPVWWMLFAGPPPPAPFDMAPPPPPGWVMPPGAWGAPPPPPGPAFAPPPGNWPLPRPGAAAPAPPPEAPQPAPATSPASPQR